MTRESRTGRLIVRHTASERRLLDEAAKQLGKGTARYVLEAALEKASVWVEAGKPAPGERK